MKISVIIPTLNEAQALPATLAHTRSLGFEEILVVDGGSTDRTREIVEMLEAQGWRSEATASNFTSQTSSLPEPQASSLKPRIIPPNASVPSSQHSAPSTLRLLTAAAGRARQMNAGAASATGEILLFLHADTLLPGDAKQAVEAVLAEPQTVGGRFDVRFERDAGLGWLISRMINLRSRLSEIATGDQAIFVRRGTFDALRGFADMPLMEDIDLTKRLKRQGRTAALRSQAITSYRRWEAHGPIRTILLMWALRFLYWIGMNPSRLKALYSDER